jgi:hypothetical protein
MGSPFFERTFQSQFPIAKNPVFVIDPHDDGDYEPLYTVLRHVYGMPLGEHPQNCPEDWSKPESRLNYCIKVYTMADKYDFPSVRQAVISIVHYHLEPRELDQEEYDLLRSKLPELPNQIAGVCGPHAPQLADGELRDCMINWFVSSFGFMGHDQAFSSRLGDGSLLDTTLMAPLLLGLTRRVSALIVERDQCGDDDWNSDSEDDSV